MQYNAAMAIRILCTGDIHLGRRPTRVPEGIDVRTLGPDEAFNRFVERAIARQVQAAVLTGDVVDAGNRFYEAYGVLQAGVKRLLDHDVPVFAVAGNHDYDVLTRLADEVTGFRLLGRGGRWQEAIVSSPDGDSVRLVGWSFSEQQVRVSPLADGFPTVGNGETVVGVLHCDCFAASSTYAPVPLAELRARPVAAWLLGHIHRPVLLAESLPLVLYPGSPQGLDPGEPGAHGAWLVEVGRGITPRAELLPLAPLRYEPIDAPLDGVSDADGFNRAILDAVRRRHAEIEDTLAPVRWVAGRLRLTGRTSLHRELPTLCPQVRDNLRVPIGDVEYFFEKIEDATRPDRSLGDLARSADPVGLLARRLLALETGEPAELAGALVRQAREAILSQRRSPAYLLLDDATEPPNDEQVRETLLHAGYAVLDSLLAQKEAVA